MSNDLTHPIFIVNGNRFASFTQQAHGIVFSAGFVFGDNYITLTQQTFKDMTHALAFAALLAA